MKKINPVRNELRTGLIVFAAASACNALLKMPQLLSGFCLGLSVILILVGILPERVYQTIKAKKRSILGR